MIRIHKEGRMIFSLITSILVFAAIILTILLPGLIWILIPILIVFALFIVFVARFFRIPSRNQVFENGVFYSPADGKIVVIEETVEQEYFKDKRLQVSVFMSVWDVHINFYPFNGKVKYYKYHPGKFLMAIHPKSSTLNERTSVVIENERNVPVLLKQIAGAVARRIVCYAKQGNAFKTGEELGFIKFGSRVDIFLPVGTEILVNQGEQVYGSMTPIARLKAK
jgi:phosphatidylserine decarboxylase